MNEPAALQHRRDAVARAWDLKRGAVLVASGLPLPIAGTDQFHDFHAHPEHVYLTGTAERVSVLAFDPVDGWVLFAPIATEDDRVWEGDREALESLATLTGIVRVSALSSLGGWLERRRGEPIAILGNHDIVGHPRAYGIDNWQALELDLDEALSSRLSDQVSEARRAKDPAELAHMRAAADASLPGHRAGLRLARPGMTERQLQVEIEVEFFRAGSERTAYGSIVASGPNSSVLHFPPGRRMLRKGDLVLVDAGAEWHGYASDVTRTFPVAADFQGIQRDIYALVLDVQSQAIAGVRPGKEYRELHLEAAHRIASGLVDLGILRGDPGSLVDRDAHALFFPHGLGHMLGLSTHDAGGCLAGRERSERFGLKWLRADLPLEPGYVVTIEPGLYFIRPLLTDPARREGFRDAVNWDRVDTLLDFGGIRIEDDVLVTATGAEVLTAAIPKEIAAIEAARREALSA